MTAIILAGGKSSRFGYDKAFIEIDGVPLIKRQLKLLRSLFEKIIIVTNEPDKYKFRGVRVVSDIIKNRGPLGGIYSGLMESSSFYNLIVSCDMPFLNLELIKYMIRLKDAFDVVVPKVKEGYETLFAIYSKNCISPISEILKTDNLRITSLLNKVKLRELNQEEISRFGAPHILFMNINTKGDLLRAEKIKESQ